MTAASNKPETPSRTVKIAVAVVVGLVVIGFSLFLILGRNAHIDTQKGFLGTRATLFADINLIAELILLVGLMMGYGFARRGNIPAHQYNQTLWVLFNVVLTMFIMIVAFSRQVVPGLPAKLLRAYYATSTLHAILGGITILCGIYILLRMNRLLPKPLRISWWKNLMRATLGLYGLVGLFGLGTYYVWYLAPREATGVTPPEATQVSQAGGKVSVEMANYAFVPPDLTIPLGTTVVFHNSDPDPHTVTFDKKEFDAFGFDEGATHEITFDQLGEFQYYCEFHGSPGLHDMAGAIHVVPADQVAALPTAVPIPTRTPEPTSAPPAAEPLGPIGFGDFKDAKAHNDEFDLMVSNLTPAAAGEYQAWLTGEGSALNLGKVVPDAGNQAQLTFVDPQGANLVANYSGFLVTVEAAGAAPASPSSEVVVGSNVPPGALGPARQLLVASSTAPEALALGLIAQTEELFRHARAVNNAALAGDFDSLNRHGEHMLYLLAGRGGKDFHDLSGDGFVDAVGDGFGIMNYAEAVTAQAQAALASPDATDNVRLHAGHLLVMADNIRDWAGQMVDLTLQAHIATASADQQAATAQAFALSQQMLDGVDANGNGVIEAVAGEGGAYTIYFHSQYLAAMGALTEEEMSAAAATATAVGPVATAAPGVTPTPVPSETPAATPTPGPVIIVYRNFEIVPSETTIKAGTEVTFVIKGSLHEPYSFDPAPAFDSGPDFGDGATYVHTFNQPGTFTILCGYHPRMKAALIVTP